MDTSTAKGRTLLLAAAFVLAACSAPPSPPAPAPVTADVPAPARVGGDRDAHGCIPSAGYRWCERSARCERPWELAKAQGFENTDEAFVGYCGMPSAR
ncbi:hypothetical protein [Pseudoxanthomonas koreensis]|uniref:hypothetical protein n=1 Tax=Pseudoxanthomonas koreensis TaxID=266061 RepID=UPI001390B424|nr:hypothetical protein [Pseudoxanthomonas koreensis]KAF1693616.1 hypothetical protein CSC64_05640 [Pseudoxanthomonas koreensis]